MNASLRFDPFAVELADLFASERYWSVGGRSHYDVHPVSQKLVMLTQKDPKATRSKLRVVENWFAELTQLVGVE